MTHSVRARLSSGWTEQTCDDATSAAALFDRLRALNPMLQVERLIDGRVVETASWTLLTVLGPIGTGMGKSRLDPSVWPSAKGLVDGSAL